MNTKVLLGILILLAVGAGGWYFLQQNNSGQVDSTLKTTVNSGIFKIHVTATGELQAKKSEKIMGPEGMRSAGIFQTSISDIVAEGTLVEEGSYVAALDRTELADKLKNVSNEIAKAESQLLQTKLDTAIEMRNLRDQLVNLTYSIEEKKLEAEQNIYEPPAVQRQTQIELEKIQRDHLQAKENYALKIEQAQARVIEVQTNLNQQLDNMQKLTALSSKFTVTAPMAGMVIYERSWNGKKGPGSKVTPWDPVVARLPDLSDMISLTYVNEVDISKVKVDQEVTVKVDAFPDNEYAGKIISVANIGEQRPNFDAKVFEVKIQLLESDSILRPAMTTSNTVLTGTYEEVHFLPLEAFFSNDSMTYVFLEKDKKLVRQEVLTGLGNETESIVEVGVEDGNIVLLNAPENAEDLPIVHLPDDVKAEYHAKKKTAAEARKTKAANEKKRMEEMMKKFKPQ
ncbi:MAG: efflux RND transporter periplasmic adaptor subunit [Bacteroidota bacterium]